MPYNFVLVREFLAVTILMALEELWKHFKLKRRRHRLSSQMKDALMRIDSLPTLNSKSADEIIGYDDRGLPR
jgi:hypothetical protein